MKRGRRLYQKELLKLKKELLESILEGYEIKEEKESYKRLKRQK